jgi:hypothetical protein
MIKRAGGKATIGIDHDNDVRWVLADVSNSKVQSKALAASIGIVALNDVGAGGSCYLRRVVSAVIGYDE